MMCVLVHSSWKEVRQRLTKVRDAVGYEFCCCIKEIAESGEHYIERTCSEGLHLKEGQYLPIFVMLLALQFTGNESFVFCT